MTKVKTRPKPIREHKGLEATNEKEDLTKKRIIDKFSDKNEKPMQYCSHDIPEKGAPVV